MPTRQPSPHADPPLRFLSPAPKVRLVGATGDPLDQAVAAARTCYSAAGIVLPEEIAPGPADSEDERERKSARRNAFARDLLASGHLTVFQHAHFQFAVENVSRHAVWSFLHGHPFYNSEQVSQRYVEVEPSRCVLPDLPPPLRRRYETLVRFQYDAYRELAERLFPVAAEAWFERFPARRADADRYERPIRRKAMEAARYVLPIGTFTRLHHTINLTTLLRYRRCAAGPDLPSEQGALVEAFVDEILRFAPELESLLAEPLPAEGFPETRENLRSTPGERAAWRADFDARMGSRISRLVAADPDAEQLVARAVRDVLGRSADRLDDDTALALALDPASNPALAETLNLTTMTKITRALAHAHYVFQKRLSHSADSQDQRHRMTPASRPVLSAHLDDEPDYVVPALVDHDPSASALYRDCMEKTWETIAALRRAGAPAEALAYLLPNAVTIRLTESTDLLHLRHKLVMRLCFNAQEEIWRASMDEADQIRRIHPRIGRRLLPACGMRYRAGLRPYCPEGKRFCGIPVWKSPPDEWRRGLL